MEQPFEDVLEGIRVKSDLRSADALKLRDTVPIVEQRNLLAKTVDHLLSSAHDVPCYCPASRGSGPWLEFNMAHRLAYGSFFTWRNTLYA
ncbi:hypothetical protein FACS1894137_17340 [Spirochaetia bacterium]|nr:hypothetical protein FACS1894137_17340 [Spirochaetia bacterium]